MCFDAMNDRCVIATQKLSDLGIGVSRAPVYFDLAQGPHQLLSQHSDLVQSFAAHNDFYVYVPFHLKIAGNVCHRHAAAFSM